MTLRQVDVARADTRRTCWVEDDPRVQVGVAIRFRGDTALWHVVAVWSYTAEATQLPRSWKVGGLA